MCIVSLISHACLSSSRRASLTPHLLLFLPGKWQNCQPPSRPPKLPKLDVMSGSIRRSSEDLANLLFRCSRVLVLFLIAGENRGYEIEVPGFETGSASRPFGMSRSSATSSFTDFFCQSLSILARPFVSSHGCGAIRIFGLWGLSSIDILL